MTNFPLRDDGVNGNRLVDETKENLLSEIWFYTILYIYTLGSGYSIGGVIAWMFIFSSWFFGMKGLFFLMKFEKQSESDILYSIRGYFTFS